jgi:phosphate transport system permease protein
MFPLKGDCLARTSFSLSFIISISLIGVILVFLVKESLPIFWTEGWYFLTGTAWHVGERFGALPMIIGTLIVTGLAICIAVPFGLGSAIITSEVLSGRLRLAVKSIIELLAGIPGVVYGLLGIVFLTTIVREGFGLIDGNTIFTAGMILGVMILPTVTTLSDDAMRNVPKEYREQALALGLNRTETVFFAVLPGAIKGIIGGILLGISRAMGETIAVMLVIGSIDRLPRPLYNVFAPAQTITSKLGREAAEALGVIPHWNALIGLGLVLFLLVMVITYIGDVIRFPANQTRGAGSVEARK